VGCLGALWPICEYLGQLPYAARVRIIGEPSMMKVITGQRKAQDRHGEPHVTGMAGIRIPRPRSMQRIEFASKALNGFPERGRL